MNTAIETNSDTTKANEVMTVVVMVNAAGRALDKPPDESLGSGKPLYGGR